VRVSNAESADAAVESETTVRTRVGRVLVKLQLRDRGQAVIFAYKSGIVTLGHNPAAGR
jgi:DNA-binding NarL/FixJ family response regulator